MGKDWVIFIGELQEQDASTFKRICFPYISLLWHCCNRFIIIKKKIMENANNMISSAGDVSFRITDKVEKVSRSVYVDIEVNAFWN